jgi:hypothetical protein
MANINNNNNNNNVYLSSKQQTVQASIMRLMICNTLRLRQGIRTIRSTGTYPPVLSGGIGPGPMP